MVTPPSYYESAKQIPHGGVASSRRTNVLSSTMRLALRVCLTLLFSKALLAYVHGKLPVSILQRIASGKRMITQAGPY
jgi:hypothetical protein